MFLDRLICRWRGCQPQRFSAKCSRCGRELPPRHGPQPEGAGETVTATAGNPFDDKAFYVPGLTIPWWLPTHGPTPPGWREPPLPMLHGCDPERKGAWLRFVDDRTRPETQP